MEELLTVARSLPSRDGADVDRYLQALATADDEQFDQLLDAVEGDVGQIVGAVDGAAGRRVAHGARGRGRALRPSRGADQGLPGG